MNKVHRAAKTYLDAGLSVIPLTPGSKVPCVEWKRYQKRRADVGELHEWFGQEPERNIGIVTGEVSGGLLVVDFDDEDAYGQWSREHPDLDETKKVRTDGGGLHLYYYLRDGESGLTTQPFSWHGKHAGEVRFNGGQVVAPPSKGNGEGWTWLSGKERAIVSLGSWGPLGLQLKPHKLATQVATGESTAYGLAALERELGRLAITPEGDRDNTLNRCAFALGQLIGGGQLDRKDTEERLAVVAARAGLGDREIEATIRSGIEAGMARPRGRPEPKPVESIPEVVEPVTEGRRPLAFLSEHELERLEEEDAPEVIGGLLKERGVLLMAGTTATYKSLLAVLLGLCRGADLDLLGRYAVSPGGTFILDAENIQLEVKRRLRWLRNGLDIPITGSVFVLPKERHPELYLDTDDGMQWLIHSLQGLDKPTVVIDPFIDHFSGTENVSQDMAAFTNRITRLIQETQGTVVIIQHQGKDTFPTRAEKDKPRGSTVLTAYVDVILNLSRKGNQVKATVAKNRYGRDGYSWVFDVLFDDEEETITFDFIGEEEKGETHQEKVRDAILELLEQATEPMGWREIRHTLPSPTPGENIVRETLRTLEAEGVVDHLGKSGTKFRYYLVARTKELGLDTLHDPAVQGRVQRTLIE